MKTSKNGKSSQGRKTTIKDDRNKKKITKTNTDKWADEVNSKTEKSQFIAFE